MYIPRLVKFRFGSCVECHLVAYGCVNKTIILWLRKNLLTFNY